MAIDSCERFAVKILRMPDFYSKEKIFPPEVDFTFLPPLALGQITAYLRTKGIKIDQDDLDIKIHHDNCYSNAPDKKVDIAIFFNENRILKYISGVQDKDLESVMEAVERKTSVYGYNAILLSLPVIYSNSSSIMFVLSIAKFLKKKYDVIIILGGASQSIDLLRKYDHKYIDYIIYGEGESALHKLLLKISGNKLNVSRNVIMSDEVHIPLEPDFAGLPIDKYRYIGLDADSDTGYGSVSQEFNRAGTLLLPFKFIKGCQHECIFCPSSANKLIHVLDIPKTVEYLKELQEKYNPTGFFFLNDTININKQYVNKLCDEIIRRKISILWSDCARADSLDKGTLLKMRAAGCIRLIFGMETASLSLLRYIKKRINLKDLEDILRWADEAGIWTGLEVICGLPHEKDEDIEETIKFLNKNRKRINNVYFSQFDLRKTSILYKNPKEFGIENIIEINQYADNGFTYFQKYGYDETNGLKWFDKKWQIIKSYKKFTDNICWNEYLPLYELDHFLFFLYAKYGNKQQISDIFSKVSAEKRNTYLDKRNHKFAVERFNKILEIDPKNETMHIKLGNIYLRQGSLSHALTHFQTVLKLNPQSSYGYQGLGFCYSEQGLLEKAIEMFKQSLRLSPENEHTNFSLGLCYYRNGEFDSAVQKFNEVLRVNDRHEQAHYYLGLCNSGIKNQQYN